MRAMCAKIQSREKHAVAQRDDRANWPAPEPMRTFAHVKKVLGVALVGSLLLAVALFVLKRDSKGEAETPVATGASVPAQPVATGAPPPAQPRAPATTAATAAPTTAAPSDADACARLATLCSTSSQKVDAAECEKDLADARKMSGAANVERSTTCMAGATTCAAASGCLSGGVGMGAVGEFFKGLGAALSH
jgi:hypothetical protein